ncbi:MULTISPECIES: hypothetical protein [unclassified Streptomyces]|uniref:hypothetical protein n=1 Tax=unclassified Streptomyces TaxID=2593676 RepID=UPI0020351116|nr:MULTISPECIES: hypothetical protein [unclassified Streptomyces]
MSIFVSHERSFPDAEDVRRWHSSAPSAPVSLAGPRLGSLWLDHAGVLITPVYDHQDREGGVMRLAWLAWLADQWGELGYSNGVLRGAVGTVAILLTAALVALALRRSRVAALAAAAVVAAAGIGWLSTH